MAREDNIRAILESNFAGMKDELIDNAVSKIMELAPGPQFYPPCEDCNKKMDEIRKAYDRCKEQAFCNGYAAILKEIEEEVEEYKSRQLSIGWGSAVMNLEDGKQIACDYILAIIRSKIKRERE